VNRQIDRSCFAFAVFGKFEQFLVNEMEVGM
ncbi:unnamed protein product, partial [marine sediment metagenome]